MRKPMIWSSQSSLLPKDKKRPHNPTTKRIHTKKHKKMCPSISLLFLMSLLLFSDLSVIESATTEYTTLIYKGCAKQQFSDPSGLYSQALSAMFGSLVTQSTKTRFYKTTTGTSQTTITGLFQCRGDLTNHDCYNCVSRLPVLSDKLCGKTIASRVQLSGCYLLYEVAGFSQISGLTLFL